MQDLNDLRFFAAVVDNGGFTAAARALRVPKSTVSKRIARLEGELDVRLIERSTRRFRVTEVGRDFHRHCEA
ncbi:MAG: LysR family transcriptional regulator, partial [Alphaproteobacteria bacterium]